jgi:CDP-glucose 4,6-dehydratase
MGCWKSALEGLGLKMSKAPSAELAHRASVNPFFWKGKSVFLTGHTGFKGGWLALWLSSMGAKVTGYALAPNTAPSFFEVSQIESGLEHSHIADIRDLERLRKAMTDAKPEIVIHMAAQPLVLNSYKSPRETFDINVMGTVNVLDSCFHTDCGLHILY